MHKLKFWPCGFPWVDAKGYPWVDVEGNPWIDNNEP